MGEQSKQQQICSNSLPCSFEFRSEASKNTYTVSIVDSIHEISIDELPTRIRSSTSIVILNERTASTVSLQGGDKFRVKMENHQSGVECKNGLLFKIFGRVFGLIELSHETPSDNSLWLTPHAACSSLDKSKLISSWKYTPKYPSIVSTRERKFTMTPPNKLEQDLRTVDSSVPFADQSDSPLDFLLSRYYSTLYSLNTPLSYFPKTALTRFKNLCNGDKKDVYNHLQKVMLTVEDIDRRHSGKFGVLGPAFNQSPSYSLENLNSWEITYQKRFLQLNGFETDSNHSKIGPAENKDVHKFSSLALRLKVREAQLQILVLLEILATGDLNDSDLMFNKDSILDKPNKRKSRKTSLIRTKKTTKKIQPTFLGMGINVTDNMDSEVRRKFDQYSWYEKLDTLIDRMGIWDTLLDKTKDDIDKNTIGFLIYVIIPYFKAKLPSVVKHVTKRVKESNLKISSALSAMKESVSDSASLNDDGKSTPQSLPPKTSSSKYRKTLIGNKVLKLRQNDTSLDTLESLTDSFKLKRSKSSLSSKNLQKRQVEISHSMRSQSMVNEKGSGQEDTETQKNASSLMFKGTNNSIFSSTKDSKSTKEKPAPFTQSLQTPIKARRQSTHVFCTPNIKTTRDNSIAGELQPNISRSIMKTPNDQITTPQSSRSIVLSSSIKKYSTKDSGQKPEQFDERNNAPCITSSPFIVENSELPNRSTATISEARNSMNSLNTDSPIFSDYNESRRKKPGEPIPIQSSPFYEAALERSPTPKKRLNFDRESLMAKLSSVKDK
ncbi:Piso0_002771 [Millerozyma farinosa CBS 7064]|uniref:Piso0_002771 protein n=1 Tax=Pichia sorbitophila (strain ATCC MYA-4447 / BCRC 22081 / CBS 7064 / NBRC 10061 / NRRL Y-12695) TaxID=559304 RepID=G8YDG7_PICSO|nr:Piso0_002771 [Millerozyma farinosa CBS 7064]